MPEIKELILKLEEQIGRLPTEDEVYNFIFGTDEDRAEILRKE